MEFNLVIISNLSKSTYFSNLLTDKIRNLPTVLREQILLCKIQILPVSQLTVSFAKFGISVEDCWEGKNKEEH